PRLRAHLVDRDAWRVVDVDRRGGERVQRLAQMPDVNLREAPLPNAGRVHTRLGGEKALGDLQATHFYAEDGGRHIEMRRRVAGDVEGQGRLSEAGAGREDHKVG